MISHRQTALLSTVNSTEWSLQMTVEVGLTEASYEVVRWLWEWTGRQEANLPLYLNGILPIMPHQFYHKFTYSEVCNKHRQFHVVEEYASNPVN